MTRILTADQFVAGVIAMLTLKNRKTFLLKDSELDEKFEKAFRRLVENESTLNIVPNFSFFTDSLHGDSTALRETLIAAKEKDLITLNNPTFHTFDIKLTEDRARRYLERVPLDPKFLEGVVEDFFPAV